MSLINDALKKAQQERVAPPNTSNLTGLTPTADPRGQGSHLFFKYLFGSLIAIALIVCATILLLSILGKPQDQEQITFRNDDMEIQFPQNVSQKEEITEKRLTQESIQSLGAPTSSDSQVTPALKLDSILALTQTESEQVDVESKETGETTDRTQQVKAVETPDDSKFLARFVDELIVSGVRLSKSGNKVIINDKVYSSMETIHRDPKLVLREITADEIVFIDQEGNSYVKTY